jgi:hypothetical protein
MPRGIPNKKPLDPDTTGYRLALEYLDSRVDVGALVDTLTQNVDLSVPEGEARTEGEMVALATEPLAIFLERLREVLTLRGWGPAPIFEIMLSGRISGFQPKETGGAQILQVKFDAEQLDAACLPNLWRAQGQKCGAAFRIAGVQLGMEGGMPAAQDLDRIIADHEAGQHDKQPDWACPLCLAINAEARLREQDTLEETI